MKITKILRMHWQEIILGLLILSYCIYFVWFTILRYQTLYAHYFDLGIMNQTVYNTFMSLKTGDFSRFLELTNPHGFDQIKRMAIHNDIFLAFLAPFYFFYSGPETLLIIQTILVSLGAIAVYGIGNIIFKKMHNSRIISLFFSFAYLMYPPLQRANQFDFHVVVLATPLILFMFYCYLNKKYALSLICAVAVLLTKEQVGLTISFFGFFVLWQNRFSFVQKKVNKNKKEIIYAIILGVVGISWFYFSMTKIIPAFRQGAHFALDYYGDFGDSPKDIFLGLLKNPLVVLRYFFRNETYTYLLNIFGPVGILSVFSPFHLLIAAPEFAINILSKSAAMRNIYFHYSAITTPFVMISALYGYNFLFRKTMRFKLHITFHFFLFGACVLFFSITKSPLPYSFGREIGPMLQPSYQRYDAFKWQKYLQNEALRVSASGRMGPIFSSRRFFYNFSEKYNLADYIVISKDEVYNGYENFKAIPAYEKLIIDVRYELIYKKDFFEVYKKL